jgi:hypothetical protein
VESDYILPLSTHHVEDVKRETWLWGISGDVHNPFDGHGGDQLIEFS